jgi:hypothetical protein
MQLFRPSPGPWLLAGSYGHVLRAMAVSTIELFLPEYRRVKSDVKTTSYVISISIVLPKNSDFSLSEPVTHISKKQINSNHDTGFYLDIMDVNNSI